MQLIPTYKWAKNVRALNATQKSFLSQPWASGVVLLVSVVVAMLLANLPFTRDLYTSILDTDLSIHIQSPLRADGTRAIDWLFPDGMTVEKFINDILMVIFFFTVGLEIKREVVNGELSSPKKAMLPVVAAAGGMLFPALIYAIFNHGTEASTGWGIPTATDIAFAIGIMSILGNKVPVSLKIFLTALAIADDLGAIIVVALFYGGSINFLLLGIALVLVIIIYLMNQQGEKRPLYYLIPAIAVWFLFYYAGVHATMSGVVMAFLIPMEGRYSRAYLERKNREYIWRLKQYNDLDDDKIEDEFPNDMQRHCLRRMSHIATNCMGLSYRLEHALNHWVGFLIMPIFALANAGVEIPDASYFNIFQYTPELGSVSMGIFFGLLLGKPLGITLASMLAIKSKVGEKPSGSTWPMLFAVACLGGIGFTMSIFVDTLSFGENAPEITEYLRASGKIAVLAGSLCSGILGSTLIVLLNKIKAKRI